MSNNLRKIVSSALKTDSSGKIMATPGIDINEGHALVVSDYEGVLYDYRLRNFAIDLNINPVRATGYPHSFNEQTKIPSNTTAVDPKMGFGTTTPDYAKPSADLDTDYGRDNWKNAFVKAYATRIEYDYFTRKWEENYGAFEDLVAKDYNDMIVDYVKVTTNDFFNGRSISLDDTTSTYKVEYCGILNQITDNAAITSGTIVDNLNTKIANLQARLDYSGMPDVLCMNSATYNLLVQEELARSFNVRDIKGEIVPGWKVPAIDCYHMTMPILLTPFIKPTISEGSTTHKIVALNQSMIDRIWMFKDGPEFFDFADPNMPLGNTRLLTNKAMLSFQNYILRGPQTGAHFTLTKTVTV